MTTQEIAWYLGWHIVEHGGPGSGNWGHAGVKGRRGGSAPKSGTGAMMSLSTGYDAIARQQFAKTGEVTGALVRGAITRQYLGKVREIHALEKKGKELTTASQEYRKKVFPDLNQRRNKAKFKSPEWHAANKEMDKHSAIAGKIWKEGCDYNDRARELKKRLREETLETLAVPKSQQATVKAEFIGLSASARKEYSKGVDIFNQLVGTGTVDGQKVTMQSTTKCRSFFSTDTGKIGMSSGAGMKTALHEMGHWFEAQDASVYKKAQDFLKRRTKGEKPIPMSKAEPGKGYDDSEVTRVDNFMNPYMGKVYSDATEIISMGIEFIYADPVDFSRKDPDYFDFIVDTLRGR